MPILVERPITLKALRQMAARQFGDLVKAVVDIEKQVMAVGGELHADEEALLLDHGSGQEHLWGINLYPDQPLPEMIEFDSMINIRPSLGNRSRSVEDPERREKIVDVVRKLIQPEE